MDVGGEQFSYDLLPASIAADMGLRLFSTVLPSLAAAIDGFSEDSFVESPWSEAALLLVSRADQLDLAKIIKDVLPNLRKNDQQVTLDEEFKGKLGSMILLVEHALKGNFEDFFTTYLAAKGFDLNTLKDRLLVKLPEVPSDE